MNFFWNLFSPPTVLSPAEQAEKDEQDWYDDYNDWCDYDEETHQCTSHKMVISEESIIGKLFNMFNEFLLIHKDAIINYKKPKRFTLIYRNTVSNEIYCIIENIAKKFITDILQDDWDNYVGLNTLYNKYRFLNGDNTYYVPLDVFVYGFSKYNDLMKIVNFDERLIPDMPLKSKEEPFANARVYVRALTNVNSSTELKTFEDYLQKTPQKKNEYLRKVSNKLQAYWKLLQKQKKQENNTNLENTQVLNKDKTISNSEDEEPVEETYTRRTYNINTSMYPKDFGGIIKDGGNVKRCIVQNKKCASKPIKTSKSQQTASKKSKTKNISKTKKVVKK
jgi:hypothetical protein